MKLDFQVWSHVLLYIYRHREDAYSAMDMCRELNVSSTASISINTKLLESCGLISIVKEGRYNVYTLTKDGEIIAEHLNAIFIALQVNRKRIR